MKAIFNQAHRQSNAIRKDLDELASNSTPTPALQGQINASLTSFSRTVDDYNKLAKQELIPAKQELAYERVKTFRSELADYRAQLERLKQIIDEQQAAKSRTELLGRRPYQTTTTSSSSTPENPYASSSTASYQTAAGGSSSSGNPLFRPTALGASPADMTREAYAMREQSFASSTHAQLDEYIERGRAVLGNLGDQREMLKGTQRRLYGVANTLGISGDTIRMVERRARQDRWIFWSGVVVFFVFCFLVLKWLR